MSRKGDLVHCQLEIFGYGRAGLRSRQKAGTQSGATIKKDGNALINPPYHTRHFKVDGLLVVCQRYLVESTGLKISRTRSGDT